MKNPVTVSALIKKVLMICSIGASSLLAETRYEGLSFSRNSISLNPTDIVEIVGVSGGIETAPSAYLFFANGDEAYTEFKGLTERQTIKPSSYIFTNLNKVDIRQGAITLKITTNGVGYVTLSGTNTAIGVNQTDIVEIVGASGGIEIGPIVSLRYSATEEYSIEFSGNTKRTAIKPKTFIFTGLREVFLGWGGAVTLKITPQGVPVTPTEKVVSFEERVVKTEADIAKNVTAITENGMGIAANATAIAANATTLGIHERRIAESLLGSEQSRSNEERLETAELRITESLTTNDQSKSNEERLETAELRITESLLGSEQSRSNEERLKVIAADIATNSTTIQDNATGITANGTAIAGNGTSIQDIATSVTTIATSVQDNATGIAANGTSIAGNGTSIQDIATSVTTIATSVQDNATGIAANGTSIAGNGTSIQDIATSVTTIATSVQDNATGIAANGTSIAGNGTSIQDIATSVTTIATSVQDNATGIAANGTGITSNASSIATNATTIAGNATSAETNSGAITQINLTLQANQNERGRNALEIGQNQLRFQALENQIGSLGSDAAFIQKLGDEFATKADLTTAISEGKTQGINAVTSDPNNWNIFTADQIQEMAVGDLVLTREENGDFVLNYEIQQSDNAKDWTTYSAQAETITGLPVNKAFVRIRTR